MRRRSGRLNGGQAGVVKPAGVTYLQASRGRNRNPSRLRVGTTGWGQEARDDRAAGVSPWMGWGDSPSLLEVLRDASRDGRLSERSRPLLGRRRHVGKAWHYPHVRLRCWSKPEAAENRRAWLGRKASSGLSERKAAAVKSSGRSHMAAFAAPATPSPHLPLRPLPHGRCLTGRCRIGFALVAGSSPAPRLGSEALTKDLARGGSPALRLRSRRWLSFSWRAQASLGKACPSPSAAREAALKPVHWTGLPGLRPVAPHPPR